MKDQLDAEPSDPAKATASISGGVNAAAEQINVGADVVGRDKVVSAGGHIIHAEPGATVIISDERKPPRDSVSRRRKAPLLGIPTPIWIVVAVLIIAIGGLILIPAINRASLPSSPAPACISADEIIVTFHILKGTNEIAALSAGETVSIEPELTIYLQAEITSVASRTLPSLDCAWTNLNIATEGRLLHNAGCRIDYHSGQSVITDAISLQLSQPSCPALAPYPFFITRKP